MAQQSSPRSIHPPVHHKCGCSPAVNRLWAPMAAPRVDDPPLLTYAQLRARLPRLPELLGHPGRWRQLDEGRLSSKSVNLDTERQNAITSCTSQIQIDSEAKLAATCWEEQRRTPCEKLHEVLTNSCGSIISTICDAAAQALLI